MLFVFLGHINLPPLLIYGLFNDAFSISGYVELNDRMIEY
jgi:hypothetical protein